MWEQMKLMIVSYNKNGKDRILFNYGYKSLASMEDFNKGQPYEAPLSELTFEVKFKIIRIYPTGKTLYRKHIKQIRGGFDDSLWDNEGVANFMRKLGVKEI